MGKDKTMELSEKLWNHDSPAIELITVPDWISKDITGSDIAAIIQGGCASGAYMPAVTYHEATATMAEHGDDVLEYIEDVLGGGPYAPPMGSSWSGMAVNFLSVAVELWASLAAQELVEEIEEMNSLN
tara:strand:+ start:1023 stop:1406 length:384 start_codon:yes stop_codon:yes gene_type:complete